MALLTYDWKAPDPTGAVSAYLNGAHLGASEVQNEAQQRLNAQKMVLENENQRRLLEASQANMALQLAQEARLERADAIRNAFAEKKDLRDTVYNNARVKALTPTPWTDITGGPASPATATPTSEITPPPVDPGALTLPDWTSEDPLAMVNVNPGSGPAAPAPGGQAMPGGPSIPAARPGGVQEPNALPSGGVVADPAMSLLPPANPLTDDVLTNINLIGRRDPKAAQQMVKEITVAKAKANMRPPPRAGAAGAPGVEADPQLAIAKATAGMDHHADGDYYQNKDGAKFKVRTYANGRAGLMPYKPEVKAAKFLWGSDGKLYPHDSQGQPLNPVPEGVMLKEHQGLKTVHIPTQGEFAINPDGTHSLLIPEGITMTTKQKEEYRDAAASVRDAQEEVAKQKALLDQNPSGVGVSWFGGGTKTAVEEAEQKLVEATKKAAGFAADFPQLIPKAAEPAPDRVFASEAAARAAGMKDGAVIWAINPNTGKPQRARLGN